MVAIRFPRAINRMMYSGQSNNTIQTFNGQFGNLCGTGNSDFSTNPTLTNFPSLGMTFVKWKLNLESYTSANPSTWQYQEDGVSIAGVLITVSGAGIVTLSNIARVSAEDVLLNYLFTHTDDGGTVRVRGYASEWS